MTVRIITAAKMTGVITAPTMTPMSPTALFSTVGGSAASKVGLNPFILYRALQHSI